MRKYLVAALFSLTISTTSFAQQPQNQYVTIVLDAPKFDAFYSALQEISMPQKSFQAIVALLQNIERQAQQEKAAEVSKEQKPKE